MSWVRIKDEKTGKALQWGGDPQDVMDEAVETIYRIYLEAWGRPPLKDEMVRLLEGAIWVAKGSLHDPNHKIHTFVCREKPSIE